MAGDHQIDQRFRNWKYGDLQVWKQVIHDHGNNRWLFMGKEGRNGCKQSKGAGMGTTDVEISAAHPVGRRERKMGVDE